jgi:hypothetical protein
MDTPPPCPACQSRRVLPGPAYDPAARRCLDCGWRARLDDNDPNTTSEGDQP